MSFLDVVAGGLPPGRRQQDLSQALAAGVFQINTAVSSFKRLSNSLGTPKDTPALREKLYVCSCTVLLLFLSPRPSHKH
jgi:syntaxin 7